MPPRRSLLHPLVYPITTMTKKNPPPKNPPPASETTAASKKNPPPTPKTQASLSVAKKAPSSSSQPATQGALGSSLRTRTWAQVAASGADQRSVRQKVEPRQVATAKSANAQVFKGTRDNPLFKVKIVNPYAGYRPTLLRQKGRGSVTAPPTSQNPAPVLPDAPQGVAPIPNVAAPANPPEAARETSPGPGPLPPAIGSSAPSSLPLNPKAPQFAAISVDVVAALGAGALASASQDGVKLKGTTATPAAPANPNPFPVTNTPAHGASVGGEQAEPPGRPYLELAWTQEVLDLVKDESLGVYLAMRRHWGSGKFPRPDPREYSFPKDKRDVATYILETFKAASTHQEAFTLMDDLWGGAVASESSALSPKRLFLGGNQDGLGTGGPPPSPETTEASVQYLGHRPPPPSQGQGDEDADLASWEDGELGDPESQRVPGQLKNDQTAEEARAVEVGDRHSEAAHGPPTPPDVSGVPPGGPSMTFDQMVAIYESGRELTPQEIVEVSQLRGLPEGVLQADGNPRWLAPGVPTTSKDYWRCPNFPVSTKLSWDGPETVDVDRVVAGLCQSLDKRNPKKTFLWSDDNDEFAEMARIDNPFGVVGDPRISAPMLKSLLQAARHGAAAFPGILRWAAIQEWKYYKLVLVRDSYYLAAGSAAEKFAQRYQEDGDYPAACAHAEEFFAQEFHRVLETRKQKVEREYTDRWTKCGKAIRWPWWEDKSRQPSVRKEEHARERAKKAQP